MVKTKHRVLSVTLAVLMSFAVCCATVANAATTSTQPQSTEQTSASTTLDVTAGVTSAVGSSASETTAPATTSSTQDKNVAQTGAAGDTVYCLNEAGWSKVYCYMWDTANGNKNNAAWPGVAMTDDGDGVWSYDVDGTYDMVIFNGGSSPQTANLNYPGNGQIYNNKTNTWEKYDQSPLVVKTLTTDIATPQYNGTEIAISAKATTTSGTDISYKFSISGAASAVLQDYSASSTVKWTPTVAGTYTITVDVKDGAGNANTKQISYVIKDDTAEVNPIIKSVFPSNNTQIGYNKPVNVVVTAAGGNTGTKLLFYKFTVKDAAGNQINKAYYTLNNTFSFTPVAKGNYSVEVSVQSSDNTTVTKTLIYDCADGVVTPTAPVTTAPITTQPQPTTSIVPTTTSVQPTTEIPTTSEGGVIGDANDDNSVNVNDATLIQKWIAKLVDDSKINLKLSDVNKDNSVNIKDATEIQKKSAGFDVNW